MSRISSGNSICGSSYDRYMEQSDISTLGKVQQQYWSTKQAVFRKLGKKEDEHIVASDIELDTKLELFLSIRDTSATLQKVVELYQDKLLVLSHEENALGRFLKDYGKQDKTSAGKMMTAVGKTMSYASQQRLTIRVPLVRLHQEVETYRLRAISDTMGTVNQMETARNDYRGALLWMKDISQELDPDTFKQLEKFRKVQNHVRKTKGFFEKYKLDCLQKIDLLAASRCNMFSHALATYQNTLLHFWEKTSKTMTAVSDGFKGYQHYEFSMLKELTEVGKKLIDDQKDFDLKPFTDENGEVDKDRLIFFEEYHDEPEEEPDKSPENAAESQPNLLSNSIERSEEKDINSELLLNLKLDSQIPSSSSSLPNATTLDHQYANSDLLTNNPELDDSEKDDMTLLSEILNSEASAVTSSLFDQHWDNLFTEAPGTSSVTGDDQIQSFLPSQLMDLDKELDMLDLQKDQLKSKSPATSSLFGSYKQTAASQKSGQSGKSNPTSKKNSTKDMSTWFNLFADLDPLANPDAIGKMTGNGEDDRNC
ncbi:Islet cell autoantigen 1 [Chamberlinius hualienensis]